MASLYRRKDSPFIWISNRNAEGKRRCKGTKFRWSKRHEVREAKKLAEVQSMHERIGRPAIRGDFQWVQDWLESRASSKGTRDAYLARWRNVTAWLAESDLTSPASIRREHAQQYLAWRKELRASKNTGLYEVKLLAMIMGEAVNREMVARNPLTNLRISKDQEKEREAFSDEQLAKLDAIFNSGAHRYT